MSTTLDSCFSTRQKATKRSPLKTTYPEETSPRGDHPPPHVYDKTRMHNLSFPMHCCGTLEIELDALWEGEQLRPRIYVPKAMGYDNGVSAGDLPHPFKTYLRGFPASVNAQVELGISINHHPIHQEAIKAAHLAMGELSVNPTFKIITSYSSLPRDSMDSARAEDHPTVEHMVALLADSNARSGLRRQQPLPGWVSPSSRNTCPKIRVSTDRSRSPLHVEQAGGLVESDRLKSAHVKPDCMLVMLGAEAIAFDTPMLKLIRECIDHITSFHDNQIDLLSKPGRAFNLYEIDCKGTLGEACHNTTLRYTPNAHLAYYPSPPMMTAIFEISRRIPSIITTDITGPQIGTSAQMDIGGTHGAQIGTLRPRTAQNIVTKPHCDTALPCLFHRTSSHAVLENVRTQSAFFCYWRRTRQPMRSLGHRQPGITDGRWSWARRPSYYKMII